jgi:hypothetical protein
VLVALRLVDRVRFSESLEFAKRGKEPSGVRMFGDAAYQVFDFGQYGPNGRPGLATYVPVLLAADGEGGPDHFIRCLNEDAIPTKGAACSLAVRYFDVVSVLNFYYLGPGSPSIPFDRFPDFPAEVVRVLETADVTDSVEQWVGRLPILE